MNPRSTVHPNAALGSQKQPPIAPGPLGAMLALTAVNALAQLVVVEELPGKGTDISVGANGTAWMVGWDSSNRERDLFRWSGTGWQEMSGKGNRIAVDPQGNPWVLEGDGDVKHWENDSWVDKPGRGTDIAVGTSGDVWMVGWYNDILDTDRNPENRDIYHWTGSDWEKVDGGAVRIAVASDGAPWILNNDGRLRLRTNGVWVEFSGRATDIGIGADGTLWVTELTNDWGEDGKLARMDGTNWLQQTRSSAAVSVDPAGLPWFTMGDGGLFRALGYEGQLMNPIFRDGQVELSFLTVNAANYILQARRDLSLPWVELERVAGNGSTATVIDIPPAGTPMSYYGVIKEEPAE